ncbi:MAG TPA: hypothetical protein VF614_05935, partial [Chthoniobacteraceae bacterium]
IFVETRSIGAQSVGPDLPEERLRNRARFRAGAEKEKKSRSRSAESGHEPLSIRAEEARGVDLEVGFKK